MANSNTDSLRINAVNRQLAKPELTQEQRRYWENLRRILVNRLEQAALSTVAS